MLTTKVSEETDAVFSKYDPYPWVVSNNRIEDDLKCLIKNKDLCMHVQNCWLWISGVFGIRNLVGTLKFENQ